MKNTSSIHYFTEVPSTMDIARSFAQDGYPDGTVIVADIQTKGHGRLARKWESDKGGLYFTMILRPDIPINLCYRINFFASLSVVSVLDSLFSIRAHVKWPNDVLVNFRKICGILSEISVENDLVMYINMGIGINVNNKPSEFEKIAVSVCEIVNHKVEIREVLEAFLKEFNRRMSDINGNDAIEEFKSHNCMLKKPVRITTLNEEISGIAHDIDQTGALILKLNDGTYKKVLYGDCLQR